MDKPAHDANGQHGVTRASRRPDALSLSLPAELVEIVAERAAELVEERRVGGVEPWIGVGDASAHLACPRSRIYALVSAGRIPHRKDGSRLLFRRSELDEWLAAGGGVRP